MCRFFAIHLRLTAASSRRRRASATLLSSRLRRRFGSALLQPSFLSSSSTVGLPWLALASYLKSNLENLHRPFPAAPNRLQLLRAIGFLAQAFNPAAEFPASARTPRSPAHA